MKESVTLEVFYSHCNHLLEYVKLLKATKVNARTRSKMTPKMMIFRGMLFSVYSPPKKAFTYDATVT